MVSRLIPLSLALFLITFTNAQFLSSLPSCIRDCIDDSQDTSCDSFDIGCFCRASSGSFLPDLVLCMHNNCDDTPDSKLFLLAPFELACQIAGTPIPAAAVSSAEAEASSFAAKGTATVISYPTATKAFSSILSTVTLTTTKDGTTYLGVYPVTIGSATTVTGKGSTVAIAKSTSLTSSSAGVLTSTSIVLVVPTSAAGSSSSKTTTAPAGVVTNSSPFQNTPSGASSQAAIGSGLALSVLLVVSIVLF